MVNFTKIFGLTGALVVFAGLANAQQVCTAGTPPTNIIRSEGTTELLPQLTINCPASGTQGTAAIQVFLSPALNITSKTLATGVTEAVVTINGVNTLGSANGATLTFSNISIPATAFTATISNIRVNANPITIGAGVPPTISATAFVSGSTGAITPVALSFSNVAFVQNGLAAAKIVASAAGALNTNSSSPGSYVVCNSYNSGGNASAVSSFFVQINENFTSAFKMAGGAPSPALTSTTEQSQVAVSSGTTTNTVLSGTRLQIAFANVPTNVTLYVPVGVIASTVGTGQIQLTNSGPGSTFGTVAAVTTPSAVNTLNLAPVSLSSGSGTATFEVMVADANNLDQYNIPVYVAAGSFSVSGAPTSAITATVSFAPIGTTTIPSFSSTSSSTTLNGPVFGLCQTSLLFPFVTNQLGFDTGIAISNTSADPFGSKLGATGQAGTCTLNYYGSGAPSPATTVTANIPAGTTNAFAISGVAAGFQGYVIAVCQFEFAHAFAFITDGVGASGGLSQGYLAGVLPGTGATARAGGESLGF
jgi:hypothetical protein